MFRALLAHPQEVLHKQHLVSCVHVMSVGCTLCFEQAYCLSSGSTVLYIQQLVYVMRLCWLAASRIGMEPILLAGNLLETSRGYLSE
jgi:hypothetical protein